MTGHGDRPVRLVSVVGPTGAVDVAVVATVPVRDLVLQLARALGEDVATWGLVLAESQRDDSTRSGGAGTPLRLDDDCSLADAGVVDGDCLRLIRA